ncbi:MAG: hypothetical protein JXA81_02725 [Sedimentisphaerales bacterium]|nr:hypothetical protein [Sedimentisphaerales bacterium]
MIRELFLRDLSLWNCVWQSTLFAVFGLAGSFLLRRRPARASQVLFLAIITAVLLPTMSVLVRHFGLGLLVDEPIALPSFETEITAETPEILISPEIRPAALEVPANLSLAEKSLLDVEIPWRLILLYVWMIASLILLGRLIIAFIGGIRLLRRAQSDRCEHIRPAADSARARLGITKGLKIRSSMDVRSPMIWCWNRPPVLLVPGDLDRHIDWVDVICHELAHWRRWDHVSGLIAELAVCVLPWNPLLWWSKKRMVRLSEQACDDWVLAGGCAGTDYAQSLLNLSPELQMAFMPTVIGKEKPMKERIYRIVKEKCSIPQVGVRWALAVTMIAATVTVGVALAQRRPARFEPPQRDEKIPAEQRERQVLAERRGDLENRARQLRARLEEVRAELAELEASGKGESDEAKALRTELRELEEAMERLEQELRGIEGQRPDREMRPRQDREPRREILRRLEELGRETEMVLQKLAEQNIGRNDETNMLYGRMRELNEQMQQVRRQLGQQLDGPGRQRMEFRREAPPEEQIRHVEELREKVRQTELELKELGGENPERAEKLHAELREIHEAIAKIERDAPSRGRENINQTHQRELRAQARRLERRLQELGDGHPDQAQELRMQLDVLQQQLRDVETEFRGSEPGTARERGRDDLEREVQNLREQMKGMNEQMGEMRELIKRLLENKQPQ